MKFAVLFQNATDADPNIRKTHMSRHLGFLQSHADMIEAAGPLTDDAKEGRDGLWIVEAARPEDVLQLIHEDPFWPTGLRKSFAILEWKQVYACGKSLIGPG
ncbi:MAG: hypothetical protein GY717_16105 [Rhodobacteraceae bacterium]|nr:hypothetical protein [Paracoccaceae bacterium]